MIPSRPIIVSAATSALTIASSVASIVGVEQRVDDAVADRPDVDRSSVDGSSSSSAGRSIAGRERDEQVAARVAARPAGPGDAEPGALGEPLALVGQQRRVGRDDDDDRAGPGRRRAGRSAGAPRPTGSGPRRPRSRRRPARRRPGATRACRSSPGRGRRPCARRGRVGTTRDAVPIPPLNSWQTIPVPPPTLPSATGPPPRRSSAAAEVLGADVEAVDVVEQRRRTSRRRPAATTTSRGSPRRSTEAATSASRTTPTLCVLVIATGVVSSPDSRTHSRPVSSPLPLSRWQPAKTGSRQRLASARHDDRDAGPDRALADHERPVALDERGVADPHARHVRDGIEGPGPAHARWRCPRSRVRIGRMLARSAVRRRHVLRRHRAEVGDPPDGRPYHRPVIPGSTSSAPLRLRRLPGPGRGRARHRRRRGVPRPARARPARERPARVATPAGPT